MPDAARLNRPLMVLGLILGLLLLFAMLLGLWPDRMQPEPSPTLEERRPIDADPTPPDEPAPPHPPTDPRSAPAPSAPPAP